MKISEVLEEEVLKKGMEKINREEEMEGLRKEIRKRDEKIKKIEEENEKEIKKRDEEIEKIKKKKKEKSEKEMKK
jgi:hypothetical protein